MNLFSPSFVSIMYEKPERKSTVTGDTHGLQPTDLCHCLLSLQLEPQKDDSNKTAKNLLIYGIVLRPFLHIMAAQQRPNKDK